MNAKPKWNPGNTLIFGQSREEYDLLKREHWSTLKEMARSPAQYLYKQCGGGSDTGSKKLGRGAHLAVLEPERFKTDVVVWHGGRRYGGEWNEFRAAHRGQEILTETEHAECVVMQQAILGDKVAAPLLQGGASEVAVLWTHEEPSVGGVPGFSFQMKGRLDYLTSQAVIDIKTARDGSISGFEMESYRNRYHTQAALYGDGHFSAARMRLPYLLVVVESKPPYPVTVRPVPERLLALGREDYRAMLQRLDICKREAKWPGYADSQVELGLPSWASFGDDDEDEDVSELGLVVGNGDL